MPACPAEMVPKILDGEAQGTPETKPHPSSGVGVRNVRDRLALIYGDKMRFEIDSTFGSRHESAHYGSAV